MLTSMYALSYQISLFTLYNINRLGIRIFGLFSAISFKIVSVVKDEHKRAYKNSNY